MAEEEDYSYIAVALVEVAADVRYYRHPALDHAVAVVAAAALAAFPSNSNAVFPWPHADASDDHSSLDAFPAIDAEEDEKRTVRYCRAFLL